MMTLTPTDTILERVHLLPDELVDRDQWVVWRDDPQQGKLPYQAHHPRKLAKVNTPATWSTFTQALQTFADLLDTPAQCAGIGYVISADDPYTGIDLDDCRAGDVIHPAARKIIDMVGGYAEISPSVTGVKIWTRANLHIEGDSTGRQADAPWGGRIEIYRERRWFACTGWRLDR